mmetsp:Transcript_25194/g.29156  ORF Transcript_25194/g.29156 Transcript_25194/m.29156 type:complete len:235 (+) Transcript_25194:118-822(+)
MTKAETSPTPNKNKNISNNKNTKHGNNYKNKKQSKPKITKEERRAKYTQLARDRRQKNGIKSRNKDVICFQCRKRGHTVSECPKAGGVYSNNNSVKSQSFTKNCCYKCGGTTHSLKLCKKLTPDEKKLVQRGGKIDYSKMELPFAVCFICNEKGHLSGMCTKNKNGIYVKGGCCRLCGSKDHLVVNCPTKQNEEKNGDDDDDQSAGDVDEYLEDEGNQESPQIIQKKKKKVVSF